MKSMFFFWASEAHSTLWAVPQGLPLVAAPGLSAGLLGESPFKFTEDISNKECETDKRMKNSGSPASLGIGPC